MLENYGKLVFSHVKIMFYFVFCVLFNEDVQLFLFQVYVSELELPWERVRAGSNAGG